MEIQTDSNGNPILNQLSKEGFVDLTFRITNLQNDGQHYKFHLSASHNDRVVGMNVILLNSIQSGFDSKVNLIKERVYRPGVHFVRTGQESDLLISTIGELYGSLKPPRKMIDEESFTAIALHQGDIDLAKQPVKLKLFGRDGEPFNEEAYYESFFNVDLPNGLVFWNEKDQDYREPLLRGLGAV